MALLVGATVVGVALAPRALARLGDRELRHALEKTSATQLDLAGVGQPGAKAYAQGLEGPYAHAALVIGNIRQALPQPLQSLVGDPHWLVRTPAQSVTVTRGQDLNLHVRLGIDLSWKDLVRPVQGELPDTYDGRGPIGIAVPRALAERADLRVGDRLPSDPGKLRVTAIVDVVDPDGGYAAHTGDLVRPTVTVSPGFPSTVTGTVLVAPDSARALEPLLASGTLTGWLPVDGSRVSYTEADALVPEARRLASNPVELPEGGRLALRTGLADIVEQTSDRIESTYALFALAFSGLAGVLGAVFALGVQTVVARRRPALALASARGAGEVQVRGVMVLEGLLITLPVSAVAIRAVTSLVPAAVGPVGRLLPWAVAALVPVLFGVLTTTRALREPRQDLQVRTRSRVRWVLEVGVAGLAVLSLLALDRRGVVESSRAVGIDPLVVAAPILLVTAVCAAALRVYPWPLAVLQRSLRSRRGPVAVLGAARAVRQPALGFAAALALVVGLAVVTFSAVMASTIRSGLEHAAREAVGADVRLSASAFDEGDLDAVRRLAGVDEAVRLSVRSGVELDLGRTAHVDVVVTDTAALHTVRPDLPALTGEYPTPILLGTDREERADSVLFESRPAHLVDVVARELLPGLDHRWVLVDESALPPGAARGDSRRQEVLIRVAPGADAADVADRAAGVAGRSGVDVEVVDVEGERAAAESSPLVGGLQPALLVAALAALLLTLVTVVLASLAAARARQQLLGVLRILGMSPRQLRGVTAWELGPIAVVAVAVGTAVGLALPRVVTRALDLRPFVGGRTSPTPVVEPALVLAGVGAFVVVVVVAGLLAVAVGRRVAPAVTVKMGER
ncbi:FtsX-like permease family protein [Nocardioides sp. T2.26MG-1]|uniref:FtsX-like permease family protein n=1 Tax=Nocardioides sp. T2.26MG-1 TaxID=3041166 RepID=UPI00253F833D|nr:FtsX-like permease family protein [Nocardioides sp. T2.26MG-1]